MLRIQGRARTPKRLKSNNIILLFFTLFRLIANADIYTYNYNGRLIMEKFIKLVQERRSVRTYNNTPVTFNLIERAVEAARLSPSAHNQQPWKFIIVDDPDLIIKIASACTSKAISFNKFIAQAPVIVAVVSEKTDIASRVGSLLKRRSFHLIDLGIAAEHFCLQAFEDGLGTCMVGWFNERKIKRLLKIPHSLRLNLLITVGYTNDIKIRSKKRKSISEIISHNSY